MNVKFPPDYVMAKLIHTIIEFGVENDKSAKTVTKALNEAGFEPSFDDEVEMLMDSLRKTINDECDCNGCKERRKEERQGSKIEDTVQDGNVFYVPFSEGHD